MIVTTKSKPSKTELMRLQHSRGARPSKYQEVFNGLAQLRVPGNIETGEGDWIKVVLATEDEIKTFKAAVWKRRRDLGLETRFYTDKTAAEPVVWITLAQPVSAPKAAPKPAPKTKKA